MNQRTAVLLLLSLLLLSNVSVKAQEQAEDDGQEESDLLMEEEHPLYMEHLYFNAKDLDRDGVINEQEFELHFQSISSDREEEEEDAMGAQLGGKWFVGNETDAGKKAFEQVDKNKDKKVTWDEWVAELFHDQPQEPFYVDGALGDVMTVDMMRSFDLDNDDHLNLTEIRNFVGKYMNREMVEAGVAGFSSDKPRKGGVGMSYLFLLEFDKDHDSKVSVEEWKDGFHVRR